MSQPPPYTRQFDFADFAADKPATPLPGVSLDAELNAAKLTLDAILANLVKIQRDDGALKNGIVNVESLSAAAIVMLGSSSKWAVRGVWATATAYVVSDVIQSGTATYVCAISHTSAAALATDIAAGRWVLIYDSAGSTPADGSVTSLKLAAGAVTTPAIGFSALDLSSFIRGAGGISAGIAPTGALMHAKKASGDVYVKSERATDSQGAVGHQIIGVSVSWSLKMGQGSNDLSLNCSGLGADSTIFGAAGYLQQVGHIWASGSAAPVAGAGVAMSYASSVGYLDAYDFTASAWKDIKLRGANTYLSGGGVDILKVTATGADFIAGTLKHGGVDVGFLGLPINTQSAGYTLDPAKRDNLIYSQNVAGQTITIPTNVSVAIPVGAVFPILNDGTNPITISAAGVTLKQVGTTNAGNRTLAVNGLATLVQVSADRWFVNGTGLS